MESINDDCLRYIFQYLNLLEAANVAATCNRLHNFVNDCIYPKSAKEIQFKLLAIADGIPATSVNQLISLKDPFDSFGYFVNRLSFVTSKNVCKSENFFLEDIEKILVLCPNLKSLTLEGFLEYAYIDNLKCITPNLEEIRIICSGRSINTFYELKGLSQPYSGTFIGVRNAAAGHFLKQNTTLSSLTIDNISSTEEDLMLFLKLNGGTLQKLQLIKFSKFYHFESIVTLIADTLLKLDHLAIVDNLSDILAHSLHKLPHLKTLKINCKQNSVSALLRTLSDRDTIEVLEILNFVIDDEKPGEKPLVFKQLKKLLCLLSSTPSLHAFLCLMTKSQMPNINSIIMQAYKSAEQDMLNLFESKKSLEKIHIHFLKDASTFPLLRGIVDILKAETNRPYLTLHLPSFKIGTEERLFLNPNRHLVNVDPKTETAMTQIVVRNCSVDEYFEYNYDCFDSDRSC